MSTLSVMCLYELSVWKVTPVFSTTENLHPWEKVPLMIEESWWLLRQKHTLFIQLFKLKPNLIFLPLYKVLIRKVSYCCSTSVWKCSHSKLALKAFPCTFSMIQNLKCVTIYPMKTQQQISNCADWLFFWHYLWWGMVAGTGVPMKVDTGLFTAQPIERDPTDRVQGTVYHMTPAGKMTRLTFTTEQCTMGFVSMRRYIFYKECWNRNKKPGNVSKILSAWN